MKPLIIAILLLLSLIIVQNVGAYFIGPGYNNLPPVIMNSTYITFEFRDVWSGALINSALITMCDNNLPFCANTTTGMIIATPEPYVQHNWTVTLNSTHYNGTVFSANFTPFQSGPYPVYLGPIVTFHLIDERTLLPFNMTQGNVTITAQTYCSNNIVVNTQVPSTSANFSLPINCNVSKMRFLVDYGVVGNYYRSIIVTPSQSSFDYNVYLINLMTSTALLINLQIYDLIGQYHDIQIVVNKNVQTGTVLITRDYVDAEDKIAAYLLQGSEYVITVLSSNKPDRIIGNLFADQAGTKIINLFDATIVSYQTTFANQVSYTTNVINNQSIRTLYNDSGNNFATATWKIYNKTCPTTDAPLTYATSSNRGAVFSYLIPPNTSANQPYCTRLDFTMSDGSNITAIFNVQSDYSVEMPAQFENPWTLQWIIFIILLIIALSLSVRTASTGTLVIVGLAALLKAFGWFVPGPTATIATWVMGLAVVVALAATLREGATR